MNAHDLAYALDSRARREGHGWRTRCPVHGGQSLNIADTRDGKLLVKCFGAGCAAADIFAELRRLDLDDDDWCPRDETEVHRRDNQTKRRAWAQQLWERSRPAPGRIEPYLLWRRIALPPPALRFHAACKHPSDAVLPAIVAKFVDIDEQFLGVQRIFLADDARHPAPVAPRKLGLGPVAGGAVRLARHDPDKPLVIGEGIESTLSLMQLRDLPGWAAGSTSGLKRLVLPRAVRRVLIAVDNDRNGAGEHAAREAGRRWYREGRRVLLATPPHLGTDWNDVLRAEVSPHG